MTARLAVQKLDDALKSAEGAERGDAIVALAAAYCLTMPNPLAAAALLGQAITLKTTAVLEEREAKAAKRRARRAKKPAARKKVA